MSKKLTLCLITILLIMTLIYPISNIYAFSNTNFVEKEWQRTNSIVLMLRPIGNTLDIRSVIVPYSNLSNIYGTVYLQQYSNGRWIHVKSWPISGTGNLASNLTYLGQLNSTYRARISVNIGGERVTQYSNTVRL